MPSDTVAPVVYREESYGTDHFILEIRCLQNRPFTDNDDRAFFKAADDIKRALFIEGELVTQEAIERKKMWLAKAAKCFHDAGILLIFADEIPNEYWARPSMPWLIVTTPCGHFTFGWRKRVIQLDWNKTLIKSTSKELFQHENVTKEDKMIHCWGYEKATEYLKVLYNAWLKGQ